ncbi:hypothetical protein HFM15_001520 [Vibrio cholerae]|nr:hypothetical protein [Vibrio cholerae]EJL6679715.1 hypothetical protein [Vibrio cholerae]
MRLKTRTMTITALVGLSALGGLLGHKFDADTGFVVGILGTYILLSVSLIATGKVKFNR